MKIIGVYYHRYRPTHIVFQAEGGQYYQASMYFQPIDPQRLEAIPSGEITETMLLPMPTYLWHLYGIEAPWHIRLAHMMAMRGVNGVSLAKLAGVSKQQINAWVNGRTKPQSINQHRLAAALNCDLRDLF